MVVYFKTCFLYTDMANLNPTKYRVSHKSRIISNAGTLTQLPQNMIDMSANFRNLPLTEASLCSDVCVKTGGAGDTPWSWVGAIRSCDLVSCISYRAHWKNMTFLKGRKCQLSACQLQQLAVETHASKPIFHSYVIKNNIIYFVAS
jgi:hypothetical protein